MATMHKVLSFTQLLRIVTRTELGLSDSPKAWLPLRSSTMCVLEQETKGLARCQAMIAYG